PYRDGVAAGGDRSTGAAGRDGRAAASAGLRPETAREPRDPANQRQQRGGGRRVQAAAARRRDLHLDAKAARQGILVGAVIPGSIEQAALASFVIEQPALAGQPARVA